MSVRNNRRGFTIVEILAVVVILGILAGVAIPMVYRYVTKSERQSYDTMAKSAQQATESYLLDHSLKSGTLRIKNLVEDQYLENTVDPKDKSKNCDGYVVYNLVNGDADTLDQYEYTVNLCCTNYQKAYAFPSGTVTDISHDNYCDALNSVDTNTGVLAPPTCTLNVDGTGNGSNYSSDVTVTMETTGVVLEKGLDVVNNSTNGEITILHTDDVENITYYGFVKNEVGEYTCQTTFTKDTVAPVVSDLDYEVDASNNRYLTGTITDDLSKVAAYAVTKTTDVPDEDVFISIEKASSYDFTYDISAMGDVYYVWGMDAAGNISDGNISSIEVPPHSYTVTYDANGGSGAPAGQTKIHGETLYLSDTVPTRSGYDFLGWSTSSTATSATYPSGGSYTTNAAITLYAVWAMNNPLNSYTCSNISVGSAPYLLSYTGKCQVYDDGNDDWRIKFLTSGTLTSTADLLIDAFLVGGGGGGGKVYEGYGGGGGGYSDYSGGNGGSGIVIIRNAR